MTPKAEALLNKIEEIYHDKAFTYKELKEKVTDAFPATLTSLVSAGELSVMNEGKSPKIYVKAKTIEIEGRKGYGTYEEFEKDYLEVIEFIDKNIRNQDKSLKNTIESIHYATVMMCLGNLPWYKWAIVNGLDISLMKSKRKEELELVENYLKELK